jgi:hypothetical protein
MDVAMLVLTIVFGLPGAAAAAFDLFDRARRRRARRGP